MAGHHFFELHGKFEDLYGRWAGSIDEVAERILMVGGVPQHTLKSLLHASRIVEDDSISAPAAMVDGVIADLRAMHERSGALIEAAEKAEDRGTVNLVDGLRDGMEKDVWMLEAWRKG